MQSRVTHLFFSDASLLLLEALLLDDFSVAQLLELALLRAQVGQLLLLHHLQQRLFDRLADENLEHRLHFDVEVEELRTHKPNTGTTHEKICRKQCIRHEMLTSPSMICVAMSAPVLAGMNMGEGGRSRNASVCTSTSASSTRSLKQFNARVKN